MSQRKQYSPEQKVSIVRRQMLVEENQLEAVIKLPSGVFKPYAGVSTAILLFTKGVLREFQWLISVGIILSFPQ